MITLPLKPTFEELVKQFTPLYKDYSLEKRFADIVDSTATSLLAFQGQDSSDEVTALVGFLRADPEFLNIMLSLVNLSSEKFKRILSAERFANKDFGTEWNLERIIRQIKRDDEYAVRIAKLFLEAQENKTLARQVADFYLAQIELPGEWQNVIRDESVIKNLIRRKLTGKYSDAKGKAIESLVRSKLEKIKEKYGITYEQGQVALVQKEVDYAIPSCSQAFVMIMISYMETTSSSQTARANEQNKMYQVIIGSNVRYPNQERALVNVVDGAGWLARRSDLRKLYSGCQHILTLKMLNQIEYIITHYVPVKFFENEGKQGKSKK